MHSMHKGVNLQALHFFLLFTKRALNFPLLLPSFPSTLLPLHPDRIIHLFILYFSDSHLLLAILLPFLSSYLAHIFRVLVSHFPPRPSFFMFFSFLFFVFPLLLSPYPCVNHLFRLSSHSGLMIIAVLFPVCRHLPLSITGVPFISSRCVLLSSFLSEHF